MRIYSICILILCTISFLFGQEDPIIRGKVVDENKEALIGATVSLRAAKTKEVLRAVFTENDGTFVLGAKAVDSVFVEISYIGYANFQTPVIAQASKELGELALSKSGVQLNAVNIVADRQFVIQKIDRVVINPEAMISSAGITSLELLERSPGINVDMNGNISMRGKSGVMVFIDDKPTYLTGADLANFLRATPSSNIATIEIMTNPPAKYDAAGNAGIINIKMKRITTIGWNGGLNLAAGKGEFFRSNNSGNLSYRRNKINFFSNLSLGYNKSVQDLTIERNYFSSQGLPLSNFTQNSIITPATQSGNAKFGFDYYKNEKITLGMSFGTSLTHSDRITDNLAQVTNGANVIQNYVDAFNPLEIKVRNGFVNGNMTFNSKTKGEITTNIDYIVYSNDYYQTLENKILNAQKVEISRSELASELPTEIGILSAKVDYLKPFKNGSRFEAGLKSSLVNTDNTANFFDVFGVNRKVNNEFTNRFIYDENINAAYINYSTSFKKMSLQLGLRAEQTRVNGDQLGNEVVKDSSFKNNYINPFPTMFLQYKVDSLMHHVLGLSIGRRVDRPAYKDMNPFTYPMDRFTFYGGNPFLVPTFSYNLDLSYTYKSYLTTTLMLSKAVDVINETNEQRGTIYYSRPGNFDEQLTYGATINGTFKLKKWWTLQMYVAQLNNSFKSQVYTETLDDSKWYTVLSPNNSFIINSRWSAELGGSYQSKILSGQFIVYPVHQIRAGLAVKVLKNMGSLKLNMSDIFYTNQIQGDIRNIANATANWFSYLDTRVATLSFSYRFSKGQNLRQRQTGAADTEQKRVKT